MSGLVQSEHTYQASWRQPEDVDRYIRRKCEGRVLNVCVGQSPLGDVTVDLDESHDPDIVADMNDLPLRDSSFDTVIFDPPWKLNYFKRQSPFFECVRVCKPDGLIIANQRWIGESENTTREEMVVRADDKWANVSVIVCHRKQSGQATLSQVIEQ